LYDKNSIFDVYELFNRKSSLEILPVFGVAGKGQTISGHGGPTANLHTKQTMRRLFIDPITGIKNSSFHLLCKDLELKKNPRNYMITDSVSGLM
jgi:hypothetical protein